MARAPKNFKHLILDVDGVLNDGTFWYSAEGKLLKRFGPDDNDALELLRPHMDVLAVSGDKRGYPITKKRVEEDMKLPLFPVSTFERAQWIAERYHPEEVCYMGDGIFDAMVFSAVGYAIAPANANPIIKPYADFITQAKGGEGAVAEAVWHLLSTFFIAPDPLKLHIKGGEWGTT